MCLSDHMILSEDKDGKHFYLHGELRSVLLNYPAGFVVILISL